MATIYIVDSTFEHHFPAPAVEASILEGHRVNLRHIASQEELASLPLEEIEILLLWACVPAIRIDRSIVARLAHCKAIVKVAVGFDNIDLDATRERGIDVYNVPDYGTEEVADHAMALLLSMSRRLAHMDGLAKAGNWDWKTIGTASRIRGTTLGIVGFGRIGGALARRAMPFGMDVCFYDPYVPSGIEKTFGVRRCNDLASLLHEADHLSIHCSLNDTSYRLLGRAQFDRMKRGVLIVNTARGAIIDTDALVDALSAGIVAGAGLDVIENEPAVDPRLARLDSVTLTSHSAFYTKESLLEMRETSARMAVEISNGKRPRNLVN